MSIASYIKNCLKRTILFQFPIVYGIFKMPSAWQMHKQFGELIKKFFISLNLNMKLYKKLPKNKEWVYKSYLILLIVVGAFSILGSSVFQFLCGLLMVFSAFLLYNPFLKCKELKEQNIPFDCNNMLKFLPDLEFLLFLCVGFCMLGVCFKPAEEICEEKEEEIEEVKEEKTINKVKKDYKNKDKNKKRKIE